MYQEWRDGGFNVTVASLEVHTTARLVTEGAREAMRRLTARFDGEEIAETDAVSVDDPIIIRLEPLPGELRAWDCADEF